MKNRFMQALNGANCGKCPPVWLMRQAGRYMKEYRNLREKYSFLELCKTPELIAEVTLQPIKTFGFDAAIIFSDILLPLEALGCSLQFDEKKGPQISPRLKEAKDIAHMKSKAVALSLSYVYEGIHCVKQQTKLPLIGFAGAPFTLASYLISGGAPRTGKNVTRFYRKDPKLFRALLRVLTDSIIEHCNMQILAGADVIQIFESSAQLLQEEELDMWSYPYIQKIIQSLTAPAIVFMKGISEEKYCKFSRCGLRGMSVDGAVDLKNLRQQLPGVVLQGNLPPEVLLKDKRTVKTQIKNLLQTMQGDPAYIFNLGHGVLPKTPEENVHLLVETIRQMV